MSKVTNIAYSEPSEVTLLSRVQNLIIIIIFIAAPAIYYWKIMVSEIQATGGKKVTAWELAKKGFSY